MPTLTTLTVGMTNYIDVHNANYAALNSAIAVLESLAGISGVDTSVPEGLKEIFDRVGIIGKDSYKPVEGTLTASAYNLTIASGAMWTGINFLRKATSTTVSMASKTTGTYYVVIDSGGVPTVASSVTSSQTAWQFSYNSSTHEVSGVVKYSACSILFDGTDYADQLTSEVLSTTYESVAARLEHIETMMGQFGNFLAEDPDAHSGLNFGYKAGTVVYDNGISVSVRTVAAGTILLSASATNYVMVSTSTGVVSKSTSGFLIGKTPLFIVTTNGSDILTVLDQRTWAFAGGAGGGGGGHDQNTDTGTSSTSFILNNLEDATPSDNCSLEVERGTSLNTSIRWNESTDTWELTNDGVNFEPLLTSESALLSNREFTKYVGLSDPPEAYEELGASSTVGYDNLDLSSHIPASGGCQAVVLGVQFWDSSPSSSTNVKFSTPGSGDFPLQAFTVWSNQNNLTTVIVPVDSAITIDYAIFASGSGTANVRIFVIGYMEKVIGIGSIHQEKVTTGIVVGAASTVDTDITNRCNRGLVHYLKVEKTAGAMTGTYDVEFYSDDAFTNMLYRAALIPITTAYEDYDPWWIRDSDETNEIHVRIVNNDASNSGTFSVTTHYEQFD